MGPEINIDSILALEKRIEEGTEDVIQLKRARNSLLNVSTRIPPEILGHVFHWNVIPEGEFDGLEKGSYNFLLVCHHWFQVASGTPELWGFWGNTLEQWSRRYRSSGTAPLDLVLDTGYRTIDANAIPFDGPLRDALRDRAASNSIRSVHFRCWDIDLIHSILSSLTLDGEGTRHSNIESLILEHYGPNISNFLAYYHFPRLRNLCLSTTSWISSWDLLKLQATSLTTLSLEFGTTPSSPTTFHLLSVLASYPDLQDLFLDEEVISQDAGDESTLRVSLRRLKKLHLRGDHSRIFRLLDRLECSETLEDVDLKLLRCTSYGIPEIIGPYLQDRIRHDHRFQGKLAIDVSSTIWSISFKIKSADEFSIPTTLPRPSCCSLSFRTPFIDLVHRETADKLCVDLIALTPRENVVRFAPSLGLHATMDIVATIPNIEHLELVGSMAYDVLFQPHLPSWTTLLPSLRSLCLVRFAPKDDGDWRPLINYLIHQTSGGQTISLRLCEGHIPPEVVKEIEGLVEEFSLGLVDGPDVRWIGPVGF